MINDSSSYTFMARSSFSAELLTRTIKEIDEIKVSTICLSDRVQTWRQKQLWLWNLCVKRDQKESPITNTQVGLADIRSSIDELILSGFYTECMFINYKT